jgi:mRNA-degrading endonuclease YafQ of YafQ-DinJ toxin-antitoxin module
LARELIILPRFKRDYRTVRKHVEFDVETLEYVFDVLIAGEQLPAALREHRLGTHKQLFGKPLFRGQPSQRRPRKSK